MISETDLGVMVTEVSEWSYCQCGLMRFWGQPWPLGEEECWVLSRERAAGSSATPGASASLHPVCPDQSLHVPLVFIIKSISTAPLVHNVCSVTSHYWLATHTSILIPSIFHVAGKVCDGGESAGQQWVHQSRTSLNVCKGETCIDNMCSKIWDWSEGLDIWLDGNIINLCKITYIKRCTIAVLYKKFKVKNINIYSIIEGKYKLFCSRGPPNAIWS